MIKHTVFVNKVGTECLCPCKCGWVLDEENTEKFINGVCCSCLNGEHEIPPFNPEDLAVMSILASSFVRQLDLVKTERSIEKMKSIMAEK